MLIDYGFKSPFFNARFRSAMWVLADLISLLF